MSTKQTTRLIGGVQYDWTSTDEQDEHMTGNGETRWTRDVTRQAKNHGVHSMVVPYCA